MPHRLIKWEGLDTQWHLTSVTGLRKQVSCFFKHGPMCRSKACPKHCRRWALQVKAHFWPVSIFFLQSFHDPDVGYQNLLYTWHTYRWTLVKIRSFGGMATRWVRYGIPSLSQNPCTYPSPKFSSSSADKTFALVVFLLSSHWNGSDMWSFIPRSRIRHYNNRRLQPSAKSKASDIKENTLWGRRKSNTCLVSPCDAYAASKTSDCWVRVGSMPVEGPALYIYQHSGNFRKIG